MTPWNLLYQPNMTITTWLQPLVSRKTTPQTDTQDGQPEEKPFPFLKLPLELRILIYHHAISDQEHNITKHRLTPLFSTNLQITREIYQFCPITAVIDVTVPKQTTWYLLSPAYHRGGITAVSGIRLANTRVIKFERAEESKGLRLKLRFRCLEFKNCAGFGKCRGCDTDVEEILWACDMEKEKLLFEFC